MIELLLFFPFYLLLGLPIFNFGVGRFTEGNEGEWFSGRKPVLFLFGEQLFLPSCLWPDSGANTAILPIL